MQPGNHVTYIDSERKVRSAIVTKVHGNGRDPRPLVNLSYFDGEKMRDATSVQHKADMVFSTEADNEGRKTPKNPEGKRLKRVNAGGYYF